MWLDRFSNPSTPASNTPNRVHSPAPRRPTHLSPGQRNGAGVGQARTTSSPSFDLSSAASSNLSLPLPTRRVNGSALRQEQRPPPDVPDPLEVLRTILAVKGDGSPREPIKQRGRSKTVDSEDSIDFGHLSIQQYIETGSTQSTTTPSDQPRPKLDARVSRQKYEDFHKSIEECDDVLKSVESYLNNFKAELGQVSAEIEGLQQRSVLLNAQLDNRRKVEKLLGPAVEEASVSPVTVKAIAEGPIDDTFAKALTEVEARYLNLRSKSKEPEKVKAAADVKPLLEDLKIKAVERIRDYFVSQIKALRSPNINAQVVQQQTFLKHKELFPFLSRNHAQLAEEIAQAYANTMRWYYSGNFQRYQSALSKLQLFPVDESNLLGSDPAGPKRNAKGTQAQYDSFSIGKRADVLKAKDDSAIPSHLAEDSKTSHFLEVPFRNFNQALLDNVSAEYSTDTDLFSSNTYHQVSRRVTGIFEPTFVIGHNLTKQLVETTTDCLGILLCVRLNQYFAFETQRRTLPVMDSYINYTNILLWPRFQKVMDMHCESLKKVPVASNRGAVAAFSLVGGGIDQSKASMAPHTVTQRFGQFLHGILVLSAEAGDDEPVANSLNRLRGEYETLMGKLAKAAGDASKRARFLYNNYSLVLTIIGDTRGRLAEEQKEHFGILVRDSQPR